MLRATSVVRRLAVRQEKVVDRLLLTSEERHRRRVALKGQGGLEFLMDLDKATVLDHGDALKLEDGRLVEVQAAPEKLVEIKTENPLRQLKVAWHLGNRHVPTEITADAIYIAEDHVLIEMVRGLGAAAALVERPFRPEKGAYAGEGGHHGHHHHDHDHDHDHHHDHAHHGHGHGHAHEHGPGCGCGHDHHHDHGEHHHHEHGHKHG